MSRLPRVSPAMIVALVAVVVASVGSAVAATLITGSQIKDRSITAIDVRKNTLGGAEINESKLGVVPRAANAATVGGRAFRQFSASANTGIGNVIFTDARMGLRVRVAANGGPQLENFNTSLVLNVQGITTLGEGTASHDNFLGRVSRLIMPGTSTFFALSTIDPTFYDLLVTRGDTAARSIHLTCAIVSVVPSDARLVCQGFG